VSFKIVVIAREIVAIYNRSSPCGVMDYNRDQETSSDGLKPTASFPITPRWATLCHQCISFFSILASVVPPKL
jgi:hypothetical protein